MIGKLNAVIYLLVPSAALTMAKYATDANGFAIGGVLRFW